MKALLQNIGIGQVDGQIDDRPPPNRAKWTVEVDGHLFGEWTVDGQLFGEVDGQLGTELDARVTSGRSSRRWTVDGHLFGKWTVDGNIFEK